MNKLIKPFLAIGLGFLAYRYLTKAFVASRVLNMKVRSINLSPISKASVVVELVNPSNTQLSFDSMAFDVSIDGYALGSLNYLKSGIISANSSTTINLPIQINPVESLTFLAYMAKNNFKAKSIELIGNVVGEGFVIPVKVTQNING